MEFISRTFRLLPEAIDNGIMKLWNGMEWTGRWIEYSTAATGTWWKRKRFSQIDKTMVEEEGVGK